MRSVTFGCPALPFPPWVLPSTTGGRACGGLQAEIIRGVASQQQWNLSFQTFPEDAFLNLNITYQQYMEHALQTKPEIDVVAGLSEIPTSSTPSACSGTCDGLAASWPPFTTFLKVAVRKEKVADDFTRLFAPFDTDVWVASLCTVLILAFSMIALSLLSPRSRKDYRFNIRSVTDALYFALLSTLGGEEDDIPWPVGPARIIRIATVTFTLVITATYTANLAAFFTAPAITLVGPTTAYELSKARVCVPLDMTIPLVTNHVSSAFTPPKEVLAGAGLESAVRYCHQSILEGTADAMITYDATVLNYLLGDGGCLFDVAMDNRPLDVIPGLTFSPVSLAFFVRANDTDLLAQLNVAILQFMRTAEYLRLLENFYLNGAMCTDTSGGSEKLTVSQLIGLFAIVGLLIALAFMFAIIERCCGCCPVPKSLSPPYNARISKFEELVEKVDRILALHEPSSQDSGSLFKTFHPHTAAKASAHSKSRCKIRTTHRAKAEWKASPDPDLHHSRPAVRQGPSGETVLD